MRRVPEVCDVWFDSGAMPFAQWHYPFENPGKIDNGEAFPADYISEAIDQTRGWFYTLLAVSVLLGKGTPFKNVLCLGHVLDKEGKKMSKSLGNIVDPNAAMAAYGADAVRWYMYTISQPGDSKRFDEKTLNEMVKRVFLILWNVKDFFDLYARTSATPASPGSSRSVPGPHILDRWMAARLHGLIRQNTSWLESYKVTEPTRAIAEFITDCSTWYVRRSRERVKAGGEGAACALITMREVLLTLAKLMAPFTPFFAEMLYQDLGGERESVHLEDWPEAKPECLNEGLERDMDQARQVVTLVLEAREKAKLHVRQPIGLLTVVLPEPLSEPLFEVLREEVNAKEIRFVQGSTASVQFDTGLSPGLIREGLARELSRRVNDLRKRQGLTIEDRISIRLSPVSGSGSSSAEGFLEIVQAAQEHQTDLLHRTLASDIQTVAQEEEGAAVYHVNGIPVGIFIHT
jgi:isoleucyl-tRNA synthetase